VTAVAPNRKWEFTARFRRHAFAAAEHKGNVAEVRERIRQIISAEAPGGLVTRVLANHIDG
jgi:hypothetical protein